MPTRHLAHRPFAHLRDERWTQSDARTVLAAWSRSGESVADFAREHGLQAQRLFWWRRRLDWAAEDAEPKLADKDIRFAPVVVTGLGREPTVVLRVGTVELEVHDFERCSVGWVIELVRELGRA